MINLILDSPIGGQNVIKVNSAGIELRLMEYLRNEIMDKVMERYSDDFMDLSETGFGNVRQGVKAWIFAQIQQNLKNKSLLVIIGNESNNIGLIYEIARGAEFEVFRLIAENEDVE